MFKTLTFLLSLLVPSLALAHGQPDPGQQWAGIRAKDKFARTELVNLGFSIEAVRDDMSYGFADLQTIEKIKKGGFQVTAHFPASEIRALDFPVGDSIYHNYAEMNAEIDSLVARFPGLAHKFTIGRSLEGREIVGIRIGAHAEDGLKPTALPAFVLMGGHHAREHLSMEIPLLIAKHMLEARDGTTLQLLESRDIFIIPMVNPDGAEFDISTGNYKMWRKNRNSNNGDRCAGVDLNRNYGYRWGTGGSSNQPCNDTFMGPAAFSEPETRAVKAFVESHPNIKMLLTLHSFSELILYPWGHSYDGVQNPAHKAAFEKMAGTMAAWNRYTPQQSSDLYITSGDTVDWAYGALGIFAFTFELSPSGGGFGGAGFYPGPNAIATTFQANLRPILYLMDLADDPLRAQFAPESTLFYGQQ